MTHPKAILQISVLALFSLVGLSVVGKSLDTPFTSQAPLGIMSVEPWKNACEETSIAIVDNFYANKSLQDKKTAKNEITKILKLKEEYFGESKDEGAEKIVYLINNFLPWEAKIVKNPSIEQIKAEIDAKKPIIFPVHGNSLRNPYFRGSFDYHVIVITGYDDKKKVYITDDPGTKYGNGYKYSYETVMFAMHDYVPNNKTITGNKIAIFTAPELSISKSYDADNDGLSKEEEIKLGTSLISADTDNDGYMDKEEVENGYSPLIAEMKLKTGVIISAQNDTKIYFLNNKSKQHIISEKILINHGWTWGQVIKVSNKFLNSLPNGQPIKE